MPKNEVTFEQVIACVRRRLLDGGVRIAEAPTLFQHVWWPNSPSFEARLASDYGIYSGPEQLNEEFDMEVMAIQECLEETGYVPDFENWQLSEGPAGRVYSSLNTRAMALSVWERIAFPLRRRGDVVYRICAPRDVLGRPLIDALIVDDFVRGISLQSANDKIDLARLKSSLVLWKRVAGAGIVASVFLLVALVLV